METNLKIIKDELRKIKKRSYKTGYHKGFRDAKVIFNENKNKTGVKQITLRMKNHLAVITWWDGFVQCFYYVLISPNKIEQIEVINTPIGLIDYVHAYCKAKNLKTLNIIVSNHENQE